jgi:DNA-binding CsgD family transcriptional regulator
MLARELDEDSTVDFEVSACELDLGSQIGRAGLPVLERLADDLGDLAVSIVLTDAHASVIGSVRGKEPSADAPTDHFYVEAPIEDPRRDTPVGTVGIKCASADVGALMLPYAQLAARTVAERLLDGAAVTQRVLFEHFLRARRRARGPIVAVNSHELLANLAAGRLVRDRDHARIWNWATQCFEANELPLTLPLSHATVAARCEPVLLGRDVVGAIVYLEELASAATSDTRKRGYSSHRPKLGWASLRSSELGIAELVAEGLTNREVAARIFLSPHTVDFHLRQIFRKLSISSRIDLTRLVVEHRATAAREGESLLSANA